MALRDGCAKAVLHLDAQLVDAVADHSAGGGAAVPGPRVRARGSGDAIGQRLQPPPIEREYADGDFCAPRQDKRRVHLCGKGGRFCANGDPETLNEAMVSFVAPAADGESGKLASSKRARRSRPRARRCDSPFSPLQVIVLCERQFIHEDVELSVRSAPFCQAVWIC